MNAADATMTRRQWLQSIGLGALAASVPPSLAAPESDTPPNIVIVFTDDQGYQDATCYGATTFDTPNLDRMAAEGVRFTDFYAAHASCSPSRAGLLTGCYPWRVGIPGVLGPGANIGLNPDETTIADMLKPLGYATACIGKWHLGDRSEFLPTRQGFDEYFGLPYSNDMWPVHYDGKPAAEGHKSRYPPLPLLENETKIQTIETLSDQATLTTRYTERALSFIRANRRRPFFLYLAHSMPHVPLAVSDKFRGKSRQGLYGDVMMEIDWSVGQITALLAELGISDNTLIVFTSDNGPWLNFGNHAGSAGPLREGKGTTFDGGQREICLMRWPRVIPAGRTCTEMACAIDLLPTIAAATGASLPDVPIDGRSILPLMKGVPGAKTPHEALFFHYGRNGQLQAVRSGRWKLHLPHSFRQYEGHEPGNDGFPGRTGRGTIGLALFDLREDIAERRNIADKHPAVVARLQALGSEHDRDIRANARPPGRVASRIRIEPTTPTVMTRSKDGRYRLPARYCQIHNPGQARYVANADRQNIGCWHSLDTFVSWDLDIAQAGSFTVIVRQSLAHPLAGSAFTVRLGDSELEGSCRTTRGWSDFADVKVGVLRVHEPGRHVLQVRPTRLAGERCLMNLRAVELVPVEE